MKKIIGKINEAKSQFFEKIKWINFQPDSSRKKKKKQKAVINKIRNEKGKDTTDSAKIQSSNSMTIQQTTWKKWTNFQMSTISQEEIKNTNRPITSTEIETVV